MPSCLGSVRASESQEPLAGVSPSTLEDNSVVTCVLACITMSPARADFQGMQPSVLTPSFARMWGRFLWLSDYVVVMLFIISAFMPSKALEQRAKRNL